jgi:peptidoglycan biosynthesis/recognition FemAB-like protein
LDGASERLSPHVELGGHAVGASFLPSDHSYRDHNGVVNAIEPAWYVDIWHHHPPNGFESGQRGGLSYFVGDFDLSSRLGASSLLAWLTKLILPSVHILFIGQSTCEFCPLPRDRSDADILATVFGLLEETRAAAALVLNLPSDAPFLREGDNARSRGLLLLLERNGFEILWGEALWYVPIDFSSTEDFLKKLPSRHRHRIRRNLKSRHEVEVRLITGKADAISAEDFHVLYLLSENVVEASKEQFVHVSREWHREFFARWDESCRLFLFYVGGKLAGFALGIVSEGLFIFKTTGLDYGTSRKYKLYFVAWFYMLDYCARCKLRYFIAGQSNDAIKSYLGAISTPTIHAIYFRNPVLRWAARCLKNRIGFGLPEGWSRAEDSEG